MGKGKTVLLLTENFPFLPGEQFLEEEVIYWEKFFDGKLVILPANARGKARSIPEGIDVDLALSKNVSLFQSVRCIFVALFSRIFIRELAYLLSTRKLKARTIATALKTSYLCIKSLYLLKRYVEAIKEKPVVYTYWFNNLCYAAALLKRRGYIGALVSRAHRFDVYEECRLNHYMPLKRQFVHDLDRLSAISSKGKIYLSERYGIPAATIEVDRLGVQVSNYVSQATDADVFVIISVSYCVEVKNIHKIAEAIKLASRKSPHIRFYWHHLGDGPLRKELEGLAYKELSTENASWKFHGEKSNDEVRKFYTTHRVDAFINASSSEGVPVSIMEAMSFGVPAIAPDVGGVSELVGARHGILLGPDPSPAELSVALSQTNFFKMQETRRNARKHVEEHFNSRNNYRRFVQTF